MTRSERLWHKLITAADCHIAASAKQLNFPSNLFPVRMLAIVSNNKRK